MTDALSKLRELVEKMVHDTVAGEKVGVYTLTLMHLDNCNRCALEALLPALEQRERELLEQAAQIADNQHKITSVLPGHCNCPRVIAERIRELRAALNPAERR